jgi:hypothetical protein
MINPPSPPAKESSRLRRWIIGSCIAAPLVCCGGPILFSRKWIDSVDNSVDLDRLVSKAREHHLPFETKEFIDPKAVPDAENSFPLVEKLMKDVPNPAKVRKAIADYKPKKGGHIPKETVSFLQTSREVAKFTRYDAHKDFDLGINILFPEFSYFREMAHALGMQAEQNAADGNIDAAIQDLGLIRNLATQLTHEKTIIGCLVNLNINLTYHRSVGRMIKLCQHDKPALGRIRKTLDAKPPLTNFSGVIQGEFYYGVTFLRNSELFGGMKAMADDSVYKEIDATKLKRSGLPDGVLQRGSLASFITHMLKIQSIFASNSNMAEASRKAEEYADSIPTTMSNVYSMVDLSVWGGPGPAIERPNLQRQILQQSIDLIAHWKGIDSPENDFPGTIPDIPDPISGGTVMYKRTGNGFIIYSFGKNRKDDGGPKNTIDRKESDDFGFEFSTQ